MDDQQEQVGARPSGGAGAEHDPPPAANVAEDIRSQVEAQGARAADSAQHAADAARRAARDLRGEEAWMASLVEQGADRLTDLAQTLRQNDLRTLLTRVEEFARRQPVLFTGAAVTLGFMLSRTVGTAQTGRGRYDH
jgi:hypothetical protein